MFKSYKIIKLKDCSHPKINAFIKRNHYSRSVSRGNRYVYALVVSGKLAGVATFGEPVGKLCQEKYNTGGGDVLECKRFCLAPNAPKNAASFFMGHCLRDLKKKSNISTVLSYADPEAGHTEGTIYRASNFKFEGYQSKKGQVIVMKGKTFHLRAAYQKINGEYTKTAQKVQKALHSGQAKWKLTAPKLIFTYKLK